MQPTHCLVRPMLRLALSIVLLTAPLALGAAETKPAKSPAKDTVSVSDIRLFTSVFNMVKQAYVDPVSDKDLMQNAIRGLLAGLDPHSEYLDKTQLQALDEDTSGSYDGLGIEVVTIRGHLRIVSPIDDTPAARAGLRPGDDIVRIDDMAVTPDNVNQAYDKLRGKAGTKIKLSIVHEGGSVAEKYTLTRAVIRVGSVRVRQIEPGYVYVRIVQFQEDTGAELRRKLDKLLTKEHPLYGVVLDLRNNPGGLLTSAVEVSDDFLDSGIIVTTRGRIKQADLGFSATPGDLLNGAPMVVLVNNGTASAAEIVSGALKDNHRALIMGRRTFGKGSVQTVLPLDDTHAIKLTTARYYTPNGTSIQAAGIQPDIVLGDLKLTAKNAPPSLITGERDLPHHLKGPNENHQPKTSDAAADHNLDDYALSEALIVLKGVALQHRRSEHPSAKKTTVPAGKG